MKLASVIPDHTPTCMMEDRVNQVLDRFDFQYPDQIDIEQICAYYKIKIRRAPEAGLAFSHSTGYRKGFIYLPEDLDYLTYKELAGEEFAHLYLHSVSQLQTTPPVIAKQERQAKDFSAYLYMPIRMLREVVLSNDQAVDISTLADEFLVSESFVYYRLSLLFPDKAAAIARSKESFGYIKWME